MKKLSLFCIFIFLLCLVSGTASWARNEGETKQGSSYGAVSYSPALPLGKTSDFISNFSFAGGTIEGGWFPADDLALGVSGSFHYFYEKNENALYTGDRNDVAVYGTQFRTNYVVPAQLKATYILRHSPHLGDKITPFVSLGSGASYQDIIGQVGTFQFGKSGWIYSMSAELGAKYPLSSPGHAFFSIRYDQGFGTDSMPTLQFLSFNLGIVGTL